MEDKDTIRAADKRIVQYNFGVLKYDMLKVTGGESMSGNAGSVEIEGKHYTGVAANAYVDRVEGKILYFSNDENKKLHESCEEVTFRLGMKADISTGQEFYRIARVYGAEGLSERALRNLVQAVGMFNDLYPIPESK